jgi:hypothetical protein
MPRASTTSRIGSPAATERPTSGSSHEGGGRHPDCRSRHRCRNAIWPTPTTGHLTFGNAWIRSVSDNSDWSATASGIVTPGDRRTGFAGVEIAAPLSKAERAAGSRAAVQSISHCRSRLTPGPWGAVLLQHCTPRASTAYFQPECGRSALIGPRVSNRLPQASTTLWRAP